MEFPGFDPNTKLAAVYYNGRKLPHLFRIRNDVTLSGLKDHLDQINRQLNYRDMRDDVRTMFSVFGQHSNRGPIELDASLVRSTEQILKVLCGPGPTKRSGHSWNHQTKKLV